MISKGMSKKSRMQYQRHQRFGRSGYDHSSSAGRRGCFPLVSGVKARMREKARDGETEYRVFVGFLVALMTVSCAPESPGLLHSAPSCSIGISASRPSGFDCEVALSLTLSVPPLLPNPPPHPPKKICEVDLSPCQ